MRRKSNVTLMVTVGLLALGVSAPANATPVVDQYTEQRPSPGGPVPLEPGQPAIPTSSGSGSGNSGMDTSGVGATNSSGRDGNGGSGQGNANSDGAVGSGNGAASSGSVSEPVDGMVTSTGDDDGSGMGWLFPAALVLVAGAAAGFAFGRRGRGPAAT